MGRHVQILVLAAAAQPALALCASNRCRVIIQVFLLSFIFVPASVVASSVYICACRQARGQCKVASAAAALLNVLFIVVWTVYVAVAVTKIKGWSGLWWIFVVDALAAGLAIAVAGYLILRARVPDPDPPAATHVSSRSRRARWPGRRSRSRRPGNRSSSSSCPPASRPARPSRCRWAPKRPPDPALPFFHF